MQISSLEGQIGAARDLVSKSQKQLEENQAKLESKLRTANSSIKQLPDMIQENEQNIKKLRKYVAL